MRQKVCRAKVALVSNSGDAVLGRGALSKRNKKQDLLERKRRELKVKLERLFEIAADWVKSRTGRRPKRGLIREAIGQYRRQGKIVDWVLGFLRASAPAIA